MSNLSESGEGKKIAELIIDKIRSCENGEELYW